MLNRLNIHGLIVWLLLLTAFQLTAQQSTAVSNQYSLNLFASPPEGGVVTGAGNYPANTGVVVSATPAEAYIFLYWSDESGELVSTEASFTYTMPAQDVELTAHFACTPDWTFEENYQFSMQFIAQIVFDDIVSLNPGDMAAAFVGGECRGYAHPMPEHDGLVFLSVGSNELSGEMIEIKLWNSNFCDSCNVSQTFAFENMAVIGTLSNPLLLQCSNEISLEIDFNAGYTWFSLNIEQYYMQPDTIFSDLSPCFDDRIIGQHSFTVFDGEKWVGSLSELSPVKMYRMRLCEAQSIEIISNQAPNTSHSLPAGSTWLGYRPNECMSPNEALQNLSPEPAYNDRILGQNAFALYNGSQWIGSLTQLCPGKGYIIKLASASELTFPSAMAKTRNDVTESEQLTLKGKHATLKSNQYSMMLVGQLNSTKPNLTIQPGDQVFAFIDGEIRGIASPMSAYDDLLFMSIGENTLKEKEVTFKVWHSENQSFYNIQESTLFEDMAERGTLDNPFPLTISPSHIQHETAFIGFPYPNPAHDKSLIDVYVTEKTQLQLHVINSRGQVVNSENLILEGMQSLEVPIHTHELEQGIYLIRLSLYGENTTKQESRSLIVH